jgi:membrane associated rhomboid family serine protease
LTTGLSTSEGLAGIGEGPERLRKTTQPRTEASCLAQPLSELADAARSSAADSVDMIPLSDGLAARRFPFVNIALIVANFAVWLFYELPHLQSSIFHASFYPCSVNGSCHAPEPWGVSWITSMFLHGSWGHILGNMIFLVVFGKNVEDAFGHLRYLVFYFAGGLVATLTQTAMTLFFGTALESRVPNLGASGAIAAVLGAYFVLYPSTKVFGLLGIWPVRVSAWFFLGFWFLYQLFEANFGLFGSRANGGGVAFFAHVGGFVFGAFVAKLLTDAGRVTPQQNREPLGAFT